MAAQTGSDDDRIIRETGIDARVAEIVAPVLSAGGFRLVRVKLTTQNNLTLQIMAEREDGSMTVEDCEEASRLVSPALDVEDPIDKAYHLELSSPGIDRPLVRRADFEAALGHIVKLEATATISGRKRFRGKLVQAGNGAVSIADDRVEAGEPVEIPFEAIVEARLVLTDELVRDALQKDKQLRQERRNNIGDSGIDAGNEADNDN